jgi:hypothetical protein
MEFTQPGFSVQGAHPDWGLIMGLHDRKHAPQLFKEPDTWTLREEERRTWWAAIILDRYIRHLEVHNYEM